MIFHRFCFSIWFAQIHTNSAFEPYNFTRRKISMITDNPWDTFLLWTHFSPSFSFFFVFFLFFFSNFKCSQKSCKNLSKFTNIRSFFGKINASNVLIILLKPNTIFSVINYVTNIRFVQAQKKLNRKKCKAWASPYSSNAKRMYIRFDILKAIWSSPI